MSREYGARWRAVGWFPALKFALVASALLACHRSAEEKEGPAQGPSAKSSLDPSASSASTSGPSTRADSQDASAGEAIVHVPVGPFNAGSLPGEAGRDPSTEGTLHKITLGPFRMDRTARPLRKHAVPPGSGGSAAQTAGFGFDEAQVLCAESGGRLCTEVEWERACKGPRSSVYAGGDVPCRGPSCSSGYDVEGLGAALEWTASSLSASSPFSGQRVLRGSPLAAPASERRCAKRVAESQRPSAEPVTFRCCYGAPNAERMRDPEDHVPFREIDLALEDLRALLLRDARTKELAEGLAYFREDAASTVLSRGPGETMGFTLTTRAVIWAPERGVELLVVTGRAGERTAFVVAYFMAGDQRVLAGSFIMKNEPGPIALAYAASIRPRMHFSGCWGCPGETGKVLFRPPESIVLLQP